MVNIPELELIVDKISNLEKIHHIEILRIIKNNDNNINISENSNGSFLNMNELKPDVVDKIKIYISLHESREKDFSNHENLKNSIIENYIS
tara:strand:+ start:137 stop:409 length:273 start_codon:yes stop_codon:yes gene_type:complete